MRALMLLLLVSSCTRAASKATPQPEWTTVKTPTFVIDAPPRWTLVQAGDHDYWMRSPHRVRDFDVGLTVSVFAGSEAPSSLDHFVTRTLASYVETPELRERILSQTRLSAGGHAAARIVSVDAGGLKYLTTLFVDGGRGIAVAGVAPEAAFAEFERTFARIGDSVHMVAATQATPPLAAAVLMLSAEFGGDVDRRNIVWLYPKAAREKTALEARIRKLVEAGEKIEFDVTPEYEGERFIAARVRVTAQRPNGEVISAVIANPPLP